MDTLLHAASFASSAAASTLFSAIWEGTVLAVSVALCLRLLPSLSAAARSAIWMNVFVLLVLLHIFPLISGKYLTATQPAQAPPLHLDARWSLLIAGSWAVLALWRGFQLVVGAIQLQRIASRAKPTLSARTLHSVLNGSQSERKVELCTSSEIERPSVFGFFRPRILIPPGLAEKLSAEELRQVILHEMEHLRRGDDWINLFQKIGLVLFPLNPILLWVERRLCAERELACDDRVLSSASSRKGYALCLTRLAEHSMLQRRLSLVLGAWERQSELVRRVHRILRKPAHAMSGWPANFVSAGLVLGALAFGIELGRSPQLLSFAPQAETALQTHSLRAAEVRPIGRRETGPTPQLVKAVMPRSTPEPLSSHRRLAAKVPRPNAVRQYIANRQAWVVLTDWQGRQFAQQVVITVDQKNRAQYAAVQIANGWFIFQI